MVELNEYCLYHIFEFLSPLEWIQISNVCQLWRLAVKKQWKKINEIVICRAGVTSVVISIKDARKIVLYAAKTCNVLKTHPLNDKIGITLGLFNYKAEGFYFDHAMQILADTATELTEISFNYPPEIEILKLIFKANNIKTIKVEQSNDFWGHVPTDGIKHLDVSFESSSYNDYFTFFKGNFRNLQTLKLKINSSGRHWIYKRILYRTLHHVCEIKSLKLRVVFYRLPDSGLENISFYSKTFPNLEELSFGVLCWNSGQYANFNENLARYCPNLRFVLLKRFIIKDNALHWLLSLPNLEKLDLQNSVISSQESCFTKEVPEMKQLSECILNFEGTTVNMTNLCDAVKKMPNLQFLRVLGLNEKESLMLTCETAVAATSQGKDVFIEGVFLGIDCKRNLRIENKKKDQIDVQMVKLRVEDYSKTTYVDDVITFVQKKLKGHHVLILEE